MEVTLTEMKGIMSSYLFQSQLDGCNPKVLFIGKIGYYASSILPMFAEAILKTVCQTPSNITPQFYKSVQFTIPSSVNAKISREDFEDVVIQFYEARQLNKPILTEYDTDNGKLPIFTLALLMCHFIDDYTNTGYIQDEYSVNIDIGKLAVIEPVTVPNISTQKPTTTPSSSPIKPQYSLNQKINDIGNSIRKFKYIRYKNHTASALIKYGNGDCWSMSAYLCKKLTEKGIKARIISMKTKYSNDHRQAQYYIGGKWYNFPVSAFNGYTGWWAVKSPSKYTVLKGCGS